MDSGLPPGAIPVDQFQSEAPTTSQAPTIHAPKGAIPIDQFESHEDYFSSPSQQLKTGLEGVAQGIAGPLAPLAETKLFNVKPEDIRSREEENPITHGVGEAAGLAGSALTGIGEAGVMAKAGEAASSLAGLGKVAEAGNEARQIAGTLGLEGDAVSQLTKQYTRDISLGYKVGESAVSQAAEMAVLQAGDETSKMILQDPNTSAQTALANVGLSAALGGAGGAIVTGAVSPLWQATAGPKVEEFLGALKNRLNGTSNLSISDQVEKAASDLGVIPDPIMRAGLSNNPHAVNAFNELKEVQRPEVMEAIEKLHRDTSDAVARSLGIAPEEVAVHSENEAGHDLLESFTREYNEKYEPIAANLDKRDAEAAHIAISDEARLDQYGRMVEEGMQKHSVNSPYYKMYEEYGNRLLDTETVGQMDKLKTEINNRLRGMNGPGTDYNVKEVLQDIKQRIAEFQERQISKQAFEAAGPEGKSMGKALLRERQAANQSYAEFARMSDELTNHLGIGDFRGAGSLKGKLTEKLAPEQLLNKFSFRNNADFIPFLEKHFPETLQSIKDQELKRLIKPAVLSAKGEQPLNIKKLADIVDKHMAGKKEYLEAIMPPGAIEKIQAARTLTEAIPNPKSSGTAGWMSKLTKHVPANAMAAASFVMGHNPVSGFLAGHTAQLLSKNAPEAIKLGYLKFLAADKPIAGAGFKAAIDYIDATYKGNNMLAKATKNVFKSGAQVLSANQRPSQVDRDKLDKMVTKFQDNPQAFISMQGQSHLGHYFPEQQEAMTQTTATALQYLQKQKPQPYKPGPLDAEIKPSKADMSKYERTLDIAQQPSIVLEHIKHGTLQASDIQDLHGMYPQLYQNMTQKVSDAMTNRHADEDQIPYKTRMGVSLFLGTPVDTTMLPASILAAQPMPKAPIPAAQGGAQGKTRKGTTTLGKSNDSYMTASQSAEKDRHSRD